MRQLSPLQYEPAYTAQRIVMWYAGRMWTLWMLLITLPLAVLVTGCLTFLRSRRELPRGVRESGSNYLGVSLRIASSCTDLVVADLSIVDLVARPQAAGGLVICLANTR